jgi:hypothetical protein
MPGVTSAYTYAACPLVAANIQTSFFLTFPPSQLYLSVRLSALISSRLDFFFQLRATLAAWSQNCCDADVARVFFSNSLRGFVYSFLV